MGGFGSGRHWFGSTKTTVEDCYSLDVNSMSREGIYDGSGWRSGTIRWSDACAGEETSSIGYEVNVSQRWLRLHYRRVRDDEQLDYKVPLTTSALPCRGVGSWGPLVVRLCVDMRWAALRPARRQAVSAARRALLRLPALL